MFVLHTSVNVHANFYFCIFYADIVDMGLST